MKTILPHKGFILEQADKHELPQAAIITTDKVLGLPEPLQRYLGYAGVVGKLPIRKVHLTQQGSMKTQPGQRWLPLSAEQNFTVTPPAFLWKARIKLFPLVNITATDRFSEGHGNMLIKLLSVIPVGDALGPEIDEGELQRYLAEMVLFPTAWLSDSIQWEVIDDHSVKATLCEAEAVATVVLHINEQGQLTRVTADRYKEEKGKYQLLPWSAQCSDYQAVNGMLIPTRIEITWHLPAGDFTWFQVKITGIEYDQSGNL